VLISFAVSTSWLSPLLTLGLFALLELINFNALEPWLYGSSTGFLAPSKGGWFLLARFWI
jgi:hypothetical protein